MSQPTGLHGTSLFSGSELAGRLAKLRRKIAEHGLDAYVVRDDVDIRYLTGVDYYSSTRKVLLIVPAEAPPSLVVPRMEFERLSQAATVPDIHAYWEMDACAGRGWAERFGEALGDATTVGVPPRMEFDVVEAMADRRVTALPLVDDIRVVKSPAELELIRCAARYADGAMRRMLAAPVLSASVGDIAARGAVVLGEMAREHPGASFANSYAYMLLQAGAGGASPHYHSSPDTVVEDGPLVLNACTALWRYTAECERTVLVGRGCADARAALALVNEAHELALSLIAPGAACAEVDLRIQHFFEEHGVAQHMRHRTGHGFGLEGHERPYTSEGSPERYAAGMAISVEPGLYIPGLGGFRHSDTLIIHEDRVECVTTWPRGTHVD